MRSSKIFYAAVAVLLGVTALGQQNLPGSPGKSGTDPKLHIRPNINLIPPAPKVATTIPKMGIHMTSAIGAFKIKRGSEAPDYGTLQISFQGTVLVSGLKGTATPGNGTELEFTQAKYNKNVYFSKGQGTLNVTGQFVGIQFFGQNVNAYYRGDGVIQMFGEFDKNLNTGYYWYDQNPKDKKYWGTSGMTVTPSPYTAAPGMGPQLKIKNITGKS